MFPMNKKLQEELKTKLEEQKESLTAELKKFASEDITRKGDMLLLPDLFVYKPKTKDRNDDGGDE